MGDQDQNTSGGDGINTNTQTDNTQNNNFDANGIAEQIFNAVNNRVPRVEKSIVNDNFSNLSADERKLAYEAYTGLKEKEKQAQINKYNNLIKENDTLKKQLNEFQTQMVNNSVNKEINNLISELGVDDEKNIKLLKGVLGDQSSTYKDGTVDLVTLKANIENVLNEYPTLKAQRQMDNDNSHNTEEEQMKSLSDDAILKALGLK